MNINSYNNPVFSNEGRIFLEGPKKREKELLFLLKVIYQFVIGFRKLHVSGACITVFGSSRFKENDYYYEAARKIGQEIAKLGFTVMTGGGPGIMEAANRGAKEVGGKSIGCNVVLPNEQKPNAYLDKWVNIEYFFIRKVLLTKYSYAFVVLPGGFGTLDEFFEALVLVQTQKVAKFPIVLFGKTYHEYLYLHFQNLVKERTIDIEDLNLFLFTDSIPETMNFIILHTQNKMQKKRIN